MWVKLSDKWKTLKQILKQVNKMKFQIMETPFQCYKREFIKDVKSGEWKKTQSIIEYGKKATASKQIDGLGIFIDDFENDLQYYIDMKQLSNMDK